jgi:integrase
MIPIPFAIMKALGHSDLQMTMHYVSLGKNHIREQVEKLNGIQIQIAIPLVGSSGKQVA